ncbi:tetratricopeptide repeat protein [Prochlorococcus sp. MIT 0916]|uniref:tetratricopeptide repeat protein n=1 Tax=Prochlorococcus sp. MIT 0916 TaxID=3082521 RepID=UPI0039B57925
MDSSNQEGEGKKKITEVKTYPVQFPLGEIKENITMNTNTSSKPSKEQIMNQAFKFHSEGNISEAKKYYQSFINQGFSNEKVFANYGIILQDLGHLKKAELWTRKAIQLNPDFSNAHLNLGNILIDLYQLEEAELSTRKAIQLNPVSAVAHSNLGTILKNLGKLEEAELSTRKAIEIKPDYAMAHSNLGIILSDLGKLKEAELSTLKAIEINPDDADSYFNLSSIELLKGNYESGLKYFEFRFKADKSFSTHGKANIKKVENEKLTKGEKLLVISEQGLGDTLQYMRYIPYLRSQGIDVAFSAQEKLHTLIQASGIDENPLTPEQANTVSEGKWIPLLSLPRTLQISPKNPIISEPYIHSTDKLNQKWKNILSKERQPIIGINWQGSQAMERSFYQGRSIPLETFSTLARNSNFNFLSLQKGFGSEQLDHCSFKNKFVQCQPQINSSWDFLENAAIIDNCDLIITCDTAIAHLAGGIGKKVWLLLRDIPFWTWGLGGETTFWYPSMRLFRQKERHNWHEVMDRVSNQLSVEILK